MNREDRDKYEIAIAMGIGKLLAGTLVTPRILIEYANAIAGVVINVFTAEYKFHPDGSPPEDDEIFVFGSNLAGIHGAGAARAALDHYGAVLGNGEGPQGRSYAIPTKDDKIESLDLDTIAAKVSAFKAHAIVNPSKKFFVTRVGCGLAGYTDEDIAPMFIGSPENISFPENWRPWLTPLERSKE